MHEISTMTDDRPEPELSNPDRLEERPWWLMPVLLVWIGLVLAGYLTMTYAWAETNEQPDDMPADTPPSPSSSAWSDECTAEDLDDGMCLTYDDIRNQPTYSQGPSGPVLVTP